MANPLAQAKSDGTRIAGNDAASLWDIGEGIACFEMHTKMNSFEPPVFDVIESALQIVQDGFAGLVIGNENPRAFSVGADLRTFLARVKTQDWQGLNAYIARGHDLFLGLKYAPFPVVAAVQGLALGGGCEFMLNTDAIVAHSGATIGLPETKVGIVPGWGGVTQLMLRVRHNPDVAQNPLAQAQSVFDTVWSGAFITSEEDVRSRSFLVPSDRVTSSLESLIGEAHAYAIELAGNYSAPDPATLVLGGQSVHRSLVEGIGIAATDNDKAIANVLAGVVSGGDAAGPITKTDRQSMQAEREGGVLLAKRLATIERIEHMLATGTPLRN
ncbi:MAG: enoyl-CoA hydratase/isomerase family protein [Rhizobiaceae bacterium]